MASRSSLELASVRFLSLVCVVTFQCELDASKLGCELIVVILRDAGDHQFVLRLAAI